MWALVALFTVSGALHIVRPHPFEAIVPRRLPYKRHLVYGSGALELVCAAGLAVPRTRRPAGLASACLLVAVFPANLRMTADIIGRRSPAVQVFAIVRLPLQLPMIRTAWRAWRSRPDRNGLSTGSE